MNKCVQQFLLETFQEGSYYGVLKTFLLKQEEKGLSSATINRLYYSLHPIGTQLHNPPITELNKQWLKSYTRQLWQTYASESVRTYIGDIKQFCKWCKKKGHLRKNIAKRLKKPKRRQQRGKIYAAPETDVFKLMAYLVEELKTAVYRDVFGLLQIEQREWLDREVKLLRDLFIVTFLYETGARVGELANLSSSQMNKATTTPAPTYTIIMVGKTEDVTRRFTQRSAELWRIWEQIRPSIEGKSAIIGWSNANPHSPIQPNGISQMLVRRCRQAKIRPFRANALRHSKVTRSVRLVGLETASKLIDHADIQTTKTYNHWQDQELNKAAKLTGLQRDFWREL